MARDERTHLANSAPELHGRAGSPLHAANVSNALLFKRRARSAAPYLTYAKTITFALCFVASALIAFAAAKDGKHEAESKRPKTPRELYNSGTAQLRDGKLEEARDSLRGAVATNDEDIMPAALFNLGHARYEIGAKDLKRLLSGPQAQDSAERARQSARGAVESLQQALADDNVDAIVRAYRRGAGARKELRAATEAVKSALAQFGVVLTTWERASADFRSTNELQPADTNATHNASIVDRQIAGLVDLLKMQQQALAQCSGEGEQLKQEMKKARKRMPPGQENGLGPGGEEEEDEDGPGQDEERDFRKPFGERGKEKSISQEQAAQLLQSIQLDSQRTLPVSDKAPKLQKRPGGDW